MPSYAITGASRGIGLEFVRQLSESSSNVVFGIVRNRTTSSSLISLAKERSNVHVLEADVLDVAALQAAAKNIAAVTGGTLDMLINNAAALPGNDASSTLTKYPGVENGNFDALDKDMRAMIDVNVIGVIHVTNIFLPLLRKGSLKKVITLSSGVGDLDLTLTTGLPLMVPYCVSKAALNMVVAKYAVELKDEGFIFLAISPGLVDTKTQPPTAEDIRMNNEMGKYFSRIAPPDFKGPITPEQSVKMMFDVVNRVTAKDTGAFISHKGNKEWL